MRGSWSFPGKAPACIAVHIVLSIGMLTALSAEMLACGSSPSSASASPLTDTQGDAGPDGSTDAADATAPSSPSQRALAPASSPGNGGDAATNNTASDAEGGSVQAKAALPSCVVDAGAPPGPPVCGDGWRDPGTEECDDGLGTAAGRRGCSSTCQILDELAVAQIGADGGLGNAPRTLGLGRHPVAASDTTFAVAYVETTSHPLALSFATFSSKGVPVSVVQGFNVQSTVLADANPVIAALPCDKYVAVWTDYGGDGDERGVAINLLTPGITPSNAPKFANTTTAFSQFDPDIVVAGNQVVVAWVDTSNAATQPDLRFRTLDVTTLTPSAEQTLAATADSEADVALAAFAGSWAAAWRDGANGLETIRVHTPSVDWTVGPAFWPGPAGIRPALAQLDSTHLLVTYAVGLDPTDSGVPNGSKIQVAVLSTAAPGSVTGTDVPAMAVTAMGLAQSAPNVVPTGGGALLAWWTEGALGNRNGEELWQKPLGWSNGALSLATGEAPLPRQVGHRAGDQRSPALTTSALPPGGAVVSAWDDLGVAFGTGEGMGDVNVELIPMPELTSPVLFVADFTTAPLGPQPSLAPWGLGFSRASPATVQTGASTVDSTPTTDQPRFGSVGATWSEGLVIEEGRTDYVRVSAPQASDFDGYHVGKVPDGGAPPYITFGDIAPDGTPTALKFTNVDIPGSANIQVYADPLAPDGTAQPGNLVHTKWVLGVPAGSQLEIAFYDNNLVFHFNAIRGTAAWSRFTLAQVGGVGINTVYPNYDPGGQTGANDTWGLQLENGLFATELIQTHGAAATRAGERLFYANGSALVDSGRIGMYAKFVPKGARSAYTAPLPIWSVDANNFATIDNATGNVIVDIGGTVQTLNTGPVTWNAQDVVELWLEAGGAAGGGTRASYRTNGGAVTTIGNNTTAQPMLVPTGAIDVLCTGTTRELTSWVQQVSFWRHGQHPAGM